MKIIKQVDTSNWKFRATCTSCDTEMEAEQGDIQHQHYDGDMRDKAYDSYYIICPVCSQHINIPKDSLPKVLQIQVKKKKNTYGGPYGGPFDR